MIEPVTTSERLGTPRITAAAPTLDRPPGYKGFAVVKTMPPPHITTLAPAPFLTGADLLTHIAMAQAVRPLALAARLRRNLYEQAALDPSTVLTATL